MIMTTVPSPAIPATSQRQDADSWVDVLFGIALLAALGVTWAGSATPTSTAPSNSNALGASTQAPTLSPAATLTPIPKPALTQTSHLATAPGVADFLAEVPSPDARLVADFVAASGDNDGIEFFLIDKKFARLYVFDADARLLATSPVLLGSAKGDDSVPGIGLRPLSAVRPSERTTPAGRFVAQRGHNTNGEDVVWVDYDAAVSMHRVRTANVKDRRLERLATPTVDDNRISYGCINVPAAFYNANVKPVFANRRAIVYVLPEVKSVQQVFGFSDGDRPAVRSAP